MGTFILMNYSITEHMVFKDLKNHTGSILISVSSRKNIHAGA